jgi:hypothetical protein
MVTLSEQQDVNGLSGTFVASLTDSLRGWIPGGFTSEYFVDTQASPMTYANRELISVQHMPLASLVTITATSSGNYFWGNWLNTALGFTTSKFPVASSVVPFLLGTSCGIGDIDASERVDVGTPLLERFVTTPDRGFWGAFGPNRASWQLGDYLIGKR